MWNRILLSLSLAFASVAVLARVVAAAGDAPTPTPKLTGTYIEFCSCERVCEQALLGDPSKRGPCSRVVGLQIDAGQRGGIALGGIAAAIVVPGPGGHEGKTDPTPVIYVDKVANETQAEAIRAIVNERFAGTFGAPFGPAKPTVIRLTRSSEVINLTVEGVADLRGRPIIGTFHHPVQLANAGAVTPYPSVGRGTGGQVVDAATGVHFDADGHSVLYGKFDFGGGKGRK